jgi:hypothetical protein
MHNYTILKELLQSLIFEISRTIDFTRPYQGEKACMEYCNLLITRLDSIDGSSDPRMVLGVLSQVRGASRALTDSISWEKYPKINKLIDNIIERAKMDIATIKAS